MSKRVVTCWSYASALRQDIPCSDSTGSPGSPCTRTWIWSTLLLLCYSSDFAGEEAYLQESTKPLSTGSVLYKPRLLRLRAFFLCTQEFTRLTACYREGHARTLKNETATQSLYSKLDEQRGQSQKPESWIFHSRAQTEIHRRALQGGRAGAFC